MSSAEVSPFTKKKLFSLDFEVLYPLISGATTKYPFFAKCKSWCDQETKPVLWFKKKYVTLETRE
jgi:hypothetical protein